jgi:hypothetical protein
MRRRRIWTRLGFSVTRGSGPDLTAVDRPNKRNRSSRDHTLWFTEAGPPERSAVIEHFYRHSLATVQRSAHSRGALGTPRGRHQRRQRRSQDHRAKSASICDPQRNRGSWAMRRESRMSCEIAAFARSGPGRLPRLGRRCRRCRYAGRRRLRRLVGPVDTASSVANYT